MISHTEGLFTRADFQIPKNLKNAAQISSIWVYPSLPCEFGQHGSVSQFAPVCSRRLATASTGHKLVFSTVNLFFLLGLGSSTSLRIALTISEGTQGPAFYMEHSQEANPEAFSPLLSHFTRPCRHSSPRSLQEGPVPRTVRISTSRRALGP